MSTLVKGYKCWQCGSELTELRLPVSRRDECESCRAEIHVCKQCELYSPSLANACREDRAEDVNDKVKANFCDYYKPKADAHQATSANKNQQAHEQAEALFGGSDTEQQTNNTDAGITDPNQAARDELKRLFSED